METPKQAVDVIMPRIQKNFKRLNRHQYWLSIVNNPYDEKYSFFIYDKVPRDRTRSTPLHDLKSYDIEYLEEVVKLLTQQTKLSIVYTGFTGLRWHSNDRLIQHSKIQGEDVRSEYDSIFKKPTN